jgi:hypothetical protein
MRRQAEPLVSIAPPSGGCNTGRFDRKGGEVFYRFDVSNLLRGGLVQQLLGFREVHHPFVDTRLCILLDAVHFCHVEMGEVGRQVEEGLIAPQVSHLCHLEISMQ